MAASYTETVRNGLSKWLESVRYKKEGWGRYPFNAKAIAPYSLHASGMAIRLLDELDILKDVGEEAKKEAAEYFRGAQDKEDGYFKDRYEDVSVYTGFNSWEEIWNQRSAVSEGLRLLGYDPVVPLPSKRFFDLSSPELTGWLEDLNWTNPGKCSEIISAAMIAFGDSLEKEKRSDASDPFSQVFSFYENEILDRETGLPTRRGCVNGQYIAVGIARMLLSYIYFGRSVPYSKKIIDYMLSKQDENGDFSNGEANIAANYNMMWVLRELNYELEGGHRVEEIQDAGNQLAHRLLDAYRKQDGGFSFTESGCQDINYSIRVGKTLPISDMTGTMMAFRCLAFVDEWNAGIIFGRQRRPFDY